MVASNGHYEPNILIYAAGVDEWFACDTTPPSSAFSFTVLIGSSYTDGTMLLIVGATPDVTPALPFNLRSGPIPIM